uniref:PH domain-containing protein n=1 Tax=Hyaloperonospora arabidopsidis (strain Emoy2) TaxID=559515 RepID=M4BSE6_HYAAE
MAFGGKLEIYLQHNVSSLTSISGKEARRHQLRIRYGTWHQSVTLRAPTSAIFETWWAALENALALPYFVSIPIVDARAHQVTVAPVIPARRNKARHKQTAMLDIMVGGKTKDIILDDMPMLEAIGPSSPTEIDVLASWRTWGSLDYFANVPSGSGPHTFNAAVGTTDNNVSSNESDSDKNSAFSRDISEFWSRPSEWKDDVYERHPHPVTFKTDNAHH